MKPGQQIPILAIALFAASADGNKDEREAIRRIVELSEAATDTAMGTDAFQKLLGPAKQIQTHYLPQIQQQASMLDMGRVIARGG
jgi:hypothetical protein